MSVFQRLTALIPFGKKEEAIFLGREITQHRDYSEATAVAIDKEVKKIVMENFNRAKSLILERIDTLHALAKALLEKEVLEGPEIDEIVNGIKAVAPVA